MRRAALIAALLVVAPHLASAQAQSPAPIQVELGRRLFYEADLSINGTMACATCHEQRRGFSDGNRVHPGALDHPGKRNVPGLQNVAQRKFLTWASHEDDLAHQALTPLTGENPIEMGMKGQEPELARRLAANPCYSRLFVAAFPERKGAIGFDTVTQALAAFERTLASHQSPYDKAAAGGAALAPEAATGQALFMGKSGCANCHSGVDFTDESFHVLEPPAADRGLAEETGRAEDSGAFRTPSLRNVAATAPYFHDGGARTLSDAIRRHGKAAQVSDADMAAISAFLDALTDRAFLADPRLSLPDEACPL